MDGSLPGPVDQNASYPETFHIPPQWAREGVKVGSLVKPVFIQEARQ